MNTNKNKSSRRRVTQKKIIGHELRQKKAISKNAWKEKNGRGKKPIYDNKCGCMCVCE